MSMSPAPSDELSAFRQVMILFVLTTAVALYAMTITIANVSLPQMQGALSATQDQIAWVVTFNIVATAVATPLTGWLAQGGLVADRLELIPKDMVHKNAAALVGWVRTTWLPYTQRVPEARRESFVEELIESYLAAHPPDSEGRTHVRMVRLEVEGHKAA